MRKSNERENQRSITGFVCFILLFLCTVCDCIGCWLACWARRQLHNWAKSTGLRFRRDKSCERKCATVQSSQTKKILLCAQWLIRKKKERERERCGRRKGEMLSFHFEHVDNQQPDFQTNSYSQKKKKKGRNSPAHSLPARYSRGILFSFFFHIFCFQFGECLFVCTRNHFS